MIELCCRSSSKAESTYEVSAGNSVRPWQSLPHRVPAPTKLELRHKMANIRQYSLLNDRETFTSSFVSHVRLKFLGLANVSSLFCKCCSDRVQP
ncbi:hypothetical protein CONLIGDRAFT_17442 [Coniochaeta ligniaria NRRL 30616]|uniref:Uncharacterized protein n=1 Tax=Coniochaeta ligniaria NRRL 30616 TaxID=1408157 RepID=A0A1J7JXB7_9PEZI|nr:hypothetical protein CONLIGDRAFT_17442 [Coniochaeta ligniaria NRRL 30616]